MELTFVKLLVNVILWCSCGKGLVHSQSPFLSAAGREKTCRKPIVEITVSPLITRSSLRELEISWDVGDQWSKGDWIALYNEAPEAKIKPLFKTEIRDSIGWTSTGIPEGRRFQENPNFNKVCLGYWAAYWKPNLSSPAAISCLGTNPKWMGDLKKVIRNIKLKDMFIPGTHDSAAFHLAFSPFKESRYHKYVFAQDENILEQLIHGARYLDFRIGYYNGIWWLNHGIVKVHPLQHVLDEIKLFLNNTQEIIFMDLHAFPVGFRERDVHQQLVKYLRKELDSYMAPPWLTWNANLGQLWDRNRRLVVAYNDRSIVAEHFDVLWWPVMQKWPDVRSLNALHSYFDGVFKMFERKSRSSSIAWAAMAELTPDVWGVISDKYGGLRRMAYTVNHNVTQWFRGDWGALCNAVAVDYIRSTGIVEAAIRWNVRKAIRSNCDP
ncbi:PI-PLC X domain-containing protein 3-like [Rhodnius prolixus]|uniref:PI-PLC X domain-containing protein 3-like n=1 Tax=Rhodnius prolixus TaxID=13249 RepID=UPI003D18EB31